MTCSEIAGCRVDEGREANSDRIDQLLAELEHSPDRFRATGGFERLLALLEAGVHTDALRRFLHEHPEHVGDLLWTIVQLDDVEPFLSECLHYLSSPDRATAAYAMEVVLRSAKSEAQIGAALNRLVSCDIAICEHAVRTLSGEGLVRLVEIFRAGGWCWAATLTESLLHRSFRPEIVEELVTDSSRERQIVGMVLATLGQEVDRQSADALRRSVHDWVRNYGKWLEDE
ncbi:MAG: hypothetical protein KF817_14970 [Phycisphaeraceae bacterium]|nr:hypothetical protein [Phycisphaeraceae bacterium]